VLGRFTCITIHMEACTNENSDCKIVALWSWVGENAAVHGRCGKGRLASEYLLAVVEGTDVVPCDHALCVDALAVALSMQVCF